MVVEPRHDAYGQLLRAALEGEEVIEIVERDDGFISANHRKENSCLRAGARTGDGRW